jgi:glycerophosphoryl diester phosphodiesterase
MSYLGYANPFYHLGRIIRGYLAPPPPRRPMPPDFYIIGHRGAPLVAPENTIAAFAKAVEFGANAIETDVCVTQDDCFILWHDADPNDTWALARQWGGEGLLYRPDVPALGSPWRRPVSELALSALQTSCRYIRRKPGPVDDEDGEAAAHVVPAVFEDFIAWLYQERRVQHIFLDLKFTPGQEDAALSLLAHLYRLCICDSFRHDLVFHLLSPHLEIVEALLARARRMTLPSTLRLYADFELPGVCDFARQLGVRNICMGCGMRVWADFRHEIAEVIAARDDGCFDTVVAWTVNNEAALAELVALGVNGIITDNPALLYRIVMDHHRKRSGLLPRTTPAVSELVGQATSKDAA